MGSIKTALGRREASGAINYLFWHLKALCRFPGDFWASCMGVGPRCRVQSPPRIFLDTETGVKPLRMSPRRQKVNIGPIAILVLYQPGKRHFLVKKGGPPLLNWNKVSVSWVKWSRPINVTTFAKSCILQYLKCGRYGWLLLNCRMKSISDSRSIFAELCCCKPRSSL